MLLFQKRFHAGLVDGSVSLTFRAWPTPRVKPQGRYRVHPIGVVEVDSLTRVSLKSISNKDAVKSGFTSKQELLDYLTPVMPEGTKEVFRVVLRYGGDGDRVQGALDTDLSDEVVAELKKRLARFDAEKKWTAKTLSLIDQYPRIAASQLAKKVKRETAEFKADVVKLKKLGLTQSFEVGYEISPKGRAFLERLKAKKK